ncbi:MAG TPA: hypothetical protein VHB20_10355 [Verrucomicrobiae bacterium]|jgi:hypothetical protein|nr:hypothetical protein [Verrucomicrobiae bacterium]
MFKTLRAVRFLIKAPFILAFLALINWMTFSGQWWIKWVALALAVAWVINLFRVLRAILLLGGLAALVAYFRKK